MIDIYINGTKAAMLVRQTFCTVDKLNSWTNSSIQGYKLCSKIRHMRLSLLFIDGIGLHVGCAMCEQLAPQCCYAFF